MPSAREILEYKCWAAYNDKTYHLSESGDWKTFDLDLQKVVDSDYELLKFILKYDLHKYPGSDGDIHHGSIRYEALPGGRHNPMAMDFRGRYNSWIYPVDFYRYIKYLRETGSEPGSIGSENIGRVLADMDEELHEIMPDYTYGQLGPRYLDIWNTFILQKAAHYGLTDESVKGDVPTKGIPDFERSPEIMECADALESLNLKIPRVATDRNFDQEMMSALRKRVANAKQKGYDKNPLVKLHNETWEAKMDPHRMTAEGADHPDYPPMMVLSILAGGMVKRVEKVLGGGVFHNVAHTCNPARGYFTTLTDAERNVHNLCYFCGDYVNAKAETMSHRCYAALEFIKGDRKSVVIGDGAVRLDAAEYTGAYFGQKLKKMKIAGDKGALAKYVEDEELRKQATNKMTQLGKIETIDVKFTIKSDPASNAMKSTGQPWEQHSCEKWGGAYPHGPFSDVENWNGQVFTELNGAPYGRTSLRWCIRPDGEMDIGVEPRHYHVGYGDQMSKQRQAAILDELKKHLKDLGYLNYDYCTTDFIYKGYSDQMGNEGHLLRDIGFDGGHDQGKYPIVYGPDAKNVARAIYLERGHITPPVPHRPEPQETPYDIMYNEYRHQGGWVRNEGADGYTNRYVWIENLAAEYLDDIDPDDVGALDTFQDVTGVYTYNDDDEDFFQWVNYEDNERSVRNDLNTLNINRWFLLTSSDPWTFRYIDLAERSTYRRDDYYDLSLELYDLRNCIQDNAPGELEHIGVHQVDEIKKCVVKFLLEASNTGLGVVRDEDEWKEKSALDEKDWVGVCQQANREIKKSRRVGSINVGVVPAFPDYIVKKCKVEKSGDVPWGA